MVKSTERHPVHDHGVQGGVAVLIGAAAIADREVALLFLAHGASLLTSGDQNIDDYLQNIFWVIQNLFIVRRSIRAETGERFVAIHTFNV